MTNSKPLLWRELAKSVPGRSNKDCRRRWWNSLAAGMTKGPWSEDEDARLIEAVRLHGLSWTHVAQSVLTRNADQCSSHWSQVLDPSINHCDWTATEDCQLLHEVLTHGTNWATIAVSHVPRRTTLALKNRFSSLRTTNHSGEKFKGLQARSGEIRAPTPNSADLCTEIGQKADRTNLWLQFSTHTPAMVGTDALNETFREDDDEYGGTSSGSSRDEDEFQEPMLLGPGQSHGQDPGTLQAWREQFTQSLNAVMSNRAAPLQMLTPTPTPTTAWTHEATPRVTPISPYNDLALASDAQLLMNNPVMPSEHANINNNTCEASVNTLLRSHRES